jgi:polysaccharide biosynthesis protein PslH
MRDLLFLTQRIPYPPIKGEKIRPLNILLRLRRSFRIHLGCLVDDPLDWEVADEVRKLCVDAHLEPLDRRLAQLRCAEGLLRGEPLSLAFFRKAALARWVERKLAEVRPAAAFVCSSAMAQYVLDAPLRPEIFIMDFADVDPDKWRQYAETARPPMRWVYAREARTLLAFDRRVAAAATASVFVSEAETALFRRLAPESAGKVHAISNGVDAAYFAPGDHARAYPAGAPAFVFTGTMDYRPNVDAVVWFAEEILPLIRREEPTARFFIVGSNPAQAVQKLASYPGVAVTGRVPDVRPYLGHATAAVAPLRISRGIQNKVLEAMAMAVPVIVTPPALEGIDAAPGREVLVAEDAPGFARQAIAAAHSRIDGQLGAAARACVLSRYSWDARLAAFDRLLERAGA